MNDRQTNLKAVFESVFWPAAAGNVFWSFCTLLVDRTVDPLCADVLSRLLILALLALYLSVEWLRNYRNFPDVVSFKFWLFDWLHICAVIFVALTASVRPDWLVKASCVYFAITTFGHWTDAWEAAEASRIDRIRLGFINLLGVVIVVGGQARGMEPWHLPTGFVVVIGLWAWYRRTSIRKLFAR